MLRSSISNNRIHVKSIPGHGPRPFPHPAFLCLKRTATVLTTFILTITSPADYLITFSTTSPICGANLSLICNNIAPLSGNIYCIKIVVVGLSISLMHMSTEIRKDSIFFHFEVAQDELSKKITCKLMFLVQIKSVQKWPKHQQPVSTRINEWMPLIWLYYLPNHKLKWSWWTKLFTRLNYLQLVTMCFKSVSF